MRIDGWSIDGYGTFSQFEHRGLSDNLTVFLGPNEAGKSTLLGFIRSILFGFPSRNQDFRYDPLYGGRHGGRLFVEGSGGIYTVQRYSDKREAFKLWRPDNSEGNEAELQQLLGHASRPLFTSIFAFSLTELQDPNFQKKDEVRERIFSSSLQGARNSARTAIAQLEKQNDPVHKQRARSSQLIDLQTRIQSAQRELEQARQRARHYEELTHQELDLSKQIEGLGEAFFQQQSQLQRYQLLIELWPKWHEKTGLQRELADQDAIDVFPDHAEARHAEILSQIKELERNVHDRQLEREGLLEQLKALVLEDRLQELAPTIDALHAERALFQEWSQALAEDDRRREAAARQLTDALATMGGDWTRQRLEGFTPTLPVVDEIRHWANQMTSAEQHLAETHRDHKTAVQTLEEADRLVAAQEQRRLELGGAQSLAELERREASLIALKTKHVELKERQAEATALQDRFHALELERRRQAPQQTAGFPQTLRFILWGAALVFGGLALWSLSGSNLIVTGALALATVIFGLLPFLRMAGTSNTGSADHFLAAQLKEVTAKLGECQSAITVRERELKALVADLSLEAPPSPFELEALLQRLVRDREQAHHVENARLECERLLSVRQTAARQAETAKAALQTAQETLEGLIQSWDAWRAAAGLMEVRTPQGVLDFLQEVGEARGHLRVLQEVENRCTALVAKLGSYRTQAAQLLLEAGEPSPGNDAHLIQGLEGLFVRIQRAKEARSTHASITEALASLDGKLASQRTELSDAAANRDALYAEAGALDATEFERRRELYEIRQELKRSIDSLQNDLETRLGLGERAEELRCELATGEVASWQEDIARLEAETQTQQAKRDEINQRLGELKKERLGLEEAADVIAHEHRVQALIEEFRQAARAWKVRALAHRMIQDTIKDMERTRQPAVLAHATDLFSHVSEGRYPRLAQHEAGDLIIEDRHGIRLDAGDLSRGTMEQLYLCLRLGLIREFAHQSVVLPLVMDDVFVNFDPERARRVAEAIARFSDDHQVLVFTCHPGTASLLTDVRPGTQVVELARYGGMNTAPKAGEMTSTLPAANTGTDDRDAREVILACLQESSAPLGRGEILRRTGLAEAAWGPAISALKEDGKIDQQGERKAAVYSIIPN